MPTYTLDSLVFVPELVYGPTPPASMAVLFGALASDTSSKRSPPPATKSP